MLLTQFSRKWREISLNTFSAELYPNEFTFNNICNLHVFSGRFICFQEESCTSRQRYVLPERVIIVLPRRGMCFLWELCASTNSHEFQKGGGVIVLSGWVIVLSGWVIVLSGWVIVGLINGILFSLGLVRCMC